MRGVRGVALRLGIAAFTLLGLAVLVFWTTAVLPGDAAAVLAGPTATAEQVQALRHQLGLDRPVPVQFWDWLAGALHGDLGHGLTSGRPVADVVGERLPNSIVLTAAAFCCAVPLAVAGGLAGGLGVARTGARAGSRTPRASAAARALDTLTLALTGIPEYVLAVALSAVFARWLGWLPPVTAAPLGGRPWSDPASMVLPVASLALVAAPFAARILRSRVIEVAGSAYVEAARLRGVTGRRLALRHVLPNAAAPAVQVLALMFAAMVGGSVVVELVFNYPGAGQELRQAVGVHDLPMVQGLALSMCAVSLVALLAGDLICGLLDPRPRAASAPLALAPVP